MTVSVTFEVESEAEEGKAKVIDRDIRSSLKELPWKMTSTGVDGFYSVKVVRITVPRLDP